MALLNAAFLKEVQEAKNDYEPIPEGEYTVKASKVEEKVTRAGDGKYINVMLDVLGPSYQGRKLFARFNTENKNIKALQVAARQFREMLLASGVPEEKLAMYNETDQIVGLTFNVKVNVRKSDDWGDQNEIKKYLKANMSVAPTLPPLPAGDSFSEAFSGGAISATASAEADAPWFA